MVPDERAQPPTLQVMLCPWKMITLTQVGKVRVPGNRGSSAKRVEEGHRWQVAAAREGHGHVGASRRQIRSRGSPKSPEWSITMLHRFCHPWPWQPSLEEPGEETNYPKEGSQNKGLLSSFQDWNSICPTSLSSTVILTTISGHCCETVTRLLLSAPSKDTGASVKWRHCLGESSYGQILGQKVHCFLK